MVPRAPYPAHTVAKLGVRLPATLDHGFTIEQKDRPQLLCQALDAGAHGFMLKDAAPAELAMAIRRVAAGELVIDSGLAASAKRIKENPLSSREREVLRLAAVGNDPSEIAACLYLSKGTVRNYLGAIVTKLGARNRLDAVRIATEAGWL